MSESWTWWTSGSLFRTPSSSAVSQLCGGGVPGCEDGLGLCGGGGCGGTRGNAGGDEGAAELGEHVFEGGFGLGGIPGLGGAAGGDVGGVVAVAGVPGDDQGVGQQGEGDGAGYGGRGAGAGF